MITPVHPIRPLVWPEIIKHIAEVLEHEPGVFIVGGAVRDALYGRPINDIDLATSGNGLSVARRLADKLGGKYYTLDAERRIGRALVRFDNNQYVIDAASFREGDLRADLDYRDFTINAMASSLANLTTLIDVHGSQQDLFEYKRLRQCNPLAIQSDPIRALRAVRFCLEFRLAMIPETKEAVRSYAPLLVDKQSGELIQAERSRDEVFKLLDKPFAASGLRLLHQLGMLQIVLSGDPSPLELEIQLGQVASLGMIANIISPQRDDNTASDLALGLAVMILDRHRRHLQEFLAHNTAIDRNVKQLMFLAVVGAGMSSRKWIKRLMLSSNEERLLELMVSGTESAPPSREMPSNREAYRFFSVFDDAGIGVILITLARYLAANHTALDAKEWGAILDQWASPLISCWFEKYDEIVKPIPVVTGDDLIQELHIMPGPIIGRLLEAIREEQAAGSIHARAEAFALASQLLKDSPDHSS